MSIADRFQHPIGDETNSPTFTGLYDDGYYALRVFRQPDLDDSNSLGSQHLGFDWNTIYDSDGNEDGDIGEPIYSVASGEVVYTDGSHPGFGKVVVLEHTLPGGSSVYSLYAHLDSIEKTSGDVAIGEKVGELGDSGLNPGDGAHLHLEVFSVADGSSYLDYLTNGLPSRPGWFAYTGASDASGASYSSDTLTEDSYSDGDFTWYNPYTYIEERLDQSLLSEFPEGGVSESIAFAEAADDFGVSDGSDVAELYLKSIFGSAISNVTYTGSEDAAFLVSDFEIPDADVNLQGGILLSSGDRPGSSNTSGTFTVEHGTAGDSDLNEIVSAALPTAGSTQDAAVLEFDIFIDDEDVDGMRFDVVFGSDEYSEYSGSSFVDVAAAWVDGDRDGNFEADENKALFNGDPTTPLSVIDKNLALNFVDNESGTYATEWDGFGALSVRPDLQQGSNSIKIAIADTGDQALDSGIYVTNLELLSDGATGEDIFKVVNGAVGQNDLEASETKEEFNLADESGSVTGTLKELSGDVITGFTDQIKLIVEQVNLLKDWVAVTSGSAILDIDEGGDGDVDGTVTLEGDFEGAEFNVDIVGENTEITVDFSPEFNLLDGTSGRDNLVGTGAADAIRSLAGSYDKMRGGAEADQFIFGSETNNGTRERDVILDYEVGVDEIVLEDGASVGSVREARDQVVIFLEEDRDAIYVRGDGVTADNINIVTDDVLGLV